MTDTLYPLRLHTRCLNPLCGRPLTDRRSQELGYGPDCAAARGLTPVPRPRLPPPRQQHGPTLFDQPREESMSDTVSLPETAAAGLVAHALNTIDEDGCCPVCCAPCAALADLDHAGLLDQFAGRAVAEIGAHTWWVDGRVDRRWLSDAWAQRGGCVHDGETTVAQDA